MSLVREALGEGESARRYRGRLVDRYAWLRRAALVVAPWHFVPAVVSGSVRRSAPRTTVGRLTCLVVYGIVVAVSAVLFPLALVPLAVAGAAATLLNRFYDRRGYGMREGLPPGALPLVGVRPASEPDFFVTAAERHGPVFKALTATNSRPAACVMGLQRGLSALGAHESCLRPTGIPHDVLIPRRMLRSMSGDEHRRYRRLFQRAFRDDVVDACVPEIGEIVASGLEDLAAGCAEARTSGVRPRAYLENLVMRSMIRVFFGLAPDSAGGRTVAAAALQIPEELRGGPRSATRRQGHSAAAAVAHEVRRQGAVLATQDASERPSFLGELVRDDAQALDDPTVVMNLAVLVRVATIDVTGLLQWIVKLLADDPQWLERIRESQNSELLARRVVLETLRLQQSEFIHRQVLETFEVDGHVVPAGWNLRVCVHESHRDSSVFEDPDRFDPDRFERHFTRHQYSPFGALGYTCLGARVTLAIAGAFVEHLASDYELEVVADGPPDFRFHWRPSHRHRVVVRRRPPG